MKLDSQDGLLYVEALISMFILSVAMLALVPMFVLATKENAAARDYTFATGLAQDKIEELKVADFDSIVDGTDSVHSHRITFTRSWTVATDTPHPGMKTLIVTVTPTRNENFGRNRPAVVRFYRAM